MGNDVLARSRATVIAELGVPLASILAEQMQLDLSNPPPTAGAIAAFQWLGSTSGKAAKRIATAIYRRNLIATGFRIAPTKSRNPVLIDRAAFLQFSSAWLLGRVAHAGKRYDGVRLTRRSDIPRPLREHHGMAKLRREQITSLVRVLDESRGTSELLLKQAVPIVREEIVKSGLRGVGLENKSVERRIRRARTNRK